MLQGQILTLMISSKVKLYYPEIVGIFTYFKANSDTEYWRFACE